MDLTLVLQRYILCRSSECIFQLIYSAYQWTRYVLSFKHCMWNASRDVQLLSVKTYSLPVKAFCYSGVLSSLADMRICRRCILGDNDFLGSRKNRLEVLRLGVGGQTADEQQLTGPVCRPGCKQHVYKQCRWTRQPSVGGTLRLCDSDIIAWCSTHECIPSPLWQSSHQPVRQWFLNST